MSSFVQKLGHALDDVIQSIEPLAHLLHEFALVFAFRKSHEEVFTMGYGAYGELKVREHVDIIDIAT